MLQVPTRKLVAGSTALTTHSKMVRGLYTRDAMMTYDKATLDSTGAFLVGQLERLDPILHMPLMDFSWSRDIDLREDVSVSDESSSYTVSSFAASNGIGSGGNKKAWASLDSTTLSRVSVDKGKVVNPLTLWAAEVGFTVVELEQSIRLGTSIDTEQLESLRMKDQADTDAMVYIGDTDIGVYGLVNANNRSDQSQVTNLTNVAVGASSSQSKWLLKTPDEILSDVNEILTSAWTAAGFAVFPDRLGLPTEQYGYIATAKVSNAGNVSIMTYILENNIAARSKRPLEIVPMKWLNGMGVGGTPQTLGTVDRMIAYNKNSRFVRFPKVPLQATNVQFRSLFQVMPYYGKLGVVEIVYPETIAYRDGL